MAFEVEETGELTRTANVTVPKEQYDKKVEDELRKLSRRVRIRGFRRGKIPMKVMKQRYGDAVVQDVIQELVNDQMNEVLKDMESVLHIGTPQVTNIPFDGQGDLEFTFGIELRPNIDPIGYLGIEVDKPKVEIDSEAIDEEIEILRKQKATMQPVELRQTIKSGDTVTVDIEGVGEFAEFEELKGQDIPLEMGSGNALPGIEEALDGAAFDAVIETDLDLGENFPVEELREKTVRIQLTVKKVEKEVLPELDDDFAQATGRAETLLELRSKIREDLTKTREKEARQLAIDDMMAKLLEQNAFELPPEFVKEQVKRAAQQRLDMFRRQGLDPDQFGLTVEAMAEQLDEEVTQQIREELLLIEISRKEEIKVEEEDLFAFAEEMAPQVGANTQQYLAFMRANEDAMNQANASVLLTKTKEQLLDQATLNEVDWPEEEEFPALDEGQEESASEEIPADEAATDEETEAKTAQEGGDEEE